MSRVSEIGRVVHCKREPFDVYVGRPGPWGNRYSHLPGTLAEFRVATREEAIAAHERWLWEQMQDSGFAVDLAALAGKTLGCWCAPKPCHAGTLARAAVYMEEWLACR